MCLQNVNITSKRENIQYSVGQSEVVSKLRYIYIIKNTPLAGKLKQYCSYTGTHTITINKTN